MSFWRAERLGLVTRASSLGLPWAESHIQGPNAVDLGDRIRVFFTSRQAVGGQPVSRPGFFDFDPAKSLSITEVSPDPILELGPLGHFDHFGIYPVSVLRDEKRFLMAYGGWTRLRSSRFDVSIGLASSEDGKKFEKIFSGPILNRNEKEPFVISSPKLRKFGERYFVFYIAGTSWFKTHDRPEPVYRIRMAYSHDLITWQRAEKDLITADLPLESQASPDVLWFEDRYHMFFSYRGPLGYMDQSAAYQIGHAFSDDLLNWTRSPEPITLVGREGSWDSDMTAYPSVFVKNGTVFMLYSGNGVGRSGVGLARLWLSEN